MTASWTMVIALVGLACAVASFAQWTVRAVVRQELEPVRRDVAVLRTAVFNHLAHGEKPDEATIRRRMEIRCGR